jgi:hypothetical protein
MSYSHAAFIANVRDEWLVDAWAEVHAEAPAGVDQ